MSDAEALASGDPPTKLRIRLGLCQGCLAEGVTHTDYLEAVIFIQLSYLAHMAGLTRQDSLNSPSPISRGTGKISAEPN